MSNVDKLAKSTVVILQSYLKSMGYIAAVHFELEGCIRADDGFKLDFKLLNQQLASLDIDGELVDEFWQNQWEYVSLFNGQTPLKEADNLAKALVLLPELFAQQGVNETLIKPVVWAGDTGKLASGSKNIFSGEQRAVHIPNAVQINVSVRDASNQNLMVKKGFGELLQQCFLQSSLSSCLLYLPEEEAFERLVLKDKYGLVDELCSPNDISGGHQGSIALYRELGKHNQKMGTKPLLFDVNNNVLLCAEHWQETARIEHRLGAASQAYNPYINVVYTLLNVIDALTLWQSSIESYTAPTPQSYGELPLSLYDKNDQLGAISLFMENNWFSNSIERVVEHQAHAEKIFPQSHNLGKRLQQAYLAQFQPANIMV
jgi:hypothetical protein